VHRQLLPLADGRGLCPSSRRKRVEVFSAGIEAHGKNPRAIAAMAEIGIDISDQESTRLSTDMLQGLDLVVTVCGHADEHCPVLPPGIRRVHWPLPDPAKATGTEEEIKTEFQAVRDDIRQRVEVLLEKELDDQP
jgi:arsenate reductase (thioredoxin)